MLAAAEGQTWEWLAKERLGYARRALEGPVQCRPAGCLLCLVAAKAAIHLVLLLPSRGSLHLPCCLLILLIAAAGQEAICMVPQGSRGKRWWEPVPGNPADWT